MISRIRDYTRKDFFGHDYLQSFRHGPASAQIPECELDMVMSCWLPLRVWSKEGKPLSMADIAAMKTRQPEFIRTVGETVANLGSSLDVEKQWDMPNAVNDASLSYARVWEKILLDAAVFSGKQNQAAVSRFDVKDLGYRLYRPYNYRRYHPDLNLLSRPPYKTIAFYRNALTQNALAPHSHSAIASCDQQGSSDFRV